MASPLIILSHGGGLLPTKTGWHGVNGCLLACGYATILHDPGRCSIAKENVPASGKRPSAAACRAVRAQGAIANGHGAHHRVQLSAGSSVQPYALFRKIWENTRRAWNYRVKQGTAQGGFDAVAVWECPRNGSIHAHWLLRWSPLDRADVEKRIRRALRKLAPNISDRCLLVQPARTTSKFAKYMAKGIDTPYADHFYLRHSPQGPIHHRRNVISLSLGPTASMIYRQRNGLSPISHPRRSKADCIPWAPAERRRSDPSIGCWPEPFGRRWRHWQRPVHAVLRPPNESVP